MGKRMGTKKRTFRNFRTTVVALTSPSAPESERAKDPNRLVFRFCHSFIIDGKVCIPPIGGAHIDID